MQRGNILYEVERMKLNLMQQISTVKVAYSGVFMMMMLMLMMMTMMLMMMMLMMPPGRANSATAAPLEN